MKRKWIDIGWSAGIIDGEGTITISPRKRTDEPCRFNGFAVVVRVASTDAAMISKLSELWGGGIGYTREARTDRHHKVYYWMITARKALNFLKVVGPFLIVKQAQAKIAVQLQSRISGHLGFDINRSSDGTIKSTWLSDSEIATRTALFWDIKKLNKRGGYHARQSQMDKSSN